jgi:hypothetical protein
MHRLSSLAAVVALSACNRAPRALPGDLDVVWRGDDRGRFIAPVAATHCAESGLVELLAIRGDTGVGLALFLKDSALIEAVEYPVVPGSLLDEPRPGANAGVRWFATTAIAAFEGVAGKVSLARNRGVLSGTLDVKFQSLDKPDTLRMTGTFSQVPVTLADSGCRLIRKRNKM